MEEIVFSTTIAEESAARLEAEGLSLEIAQHRSVRFAVPIYRDVSPFHYISMIVTLDLLGKLGIECDIQTIVGVPVFDARNTLANRMLATNYTDLMFIDADEASDAFDVVRLLASGLPFVGGVGKKKSTVSDSELSASCCTFLDRNGNVPITDAGFVEVEGIGTGFLLINRSVFEKMRDAHPEWMRESVHSQKEEFFEFFACDLDETGMRREGEDLSFSRRWRNLGGTIFMHPNICIDHYGTFNYTGDISQFFEHPMIRHKSEFRGNPR